MEDVSSNDSATHRPHLLLFQPLPVWKRKYIHNSGSPPHKSLNNGTLSLNINTVCSVCRQLGFQNDIGVRCCAWWTFYFCGLTQSNNFKGPWGQRLQRGNDKTEIRRYAERNEMKMRPGNSIDSISVCNLGLFRSRGQSRLPHKKEKENTRLRHEPHTG